jgi:hypothetical protein
LSLVKFIVIRRRFAPFTAKLATLLMYGHWDGPYAQNIWERKMRRPLSIAACAAALLFSGVSMVALSPPAAAQMNVRIGFDFFHNRLAHDGRWIRHSVWGDVWRPRPGLVGSDFQPYTNGYWEYTDEYGWYWVSEDPFDDVVYHYGRWVYDPQWQWLWVPGYTWAPAWVVWREGDDYTGWMPMPPDEEFASGAGFRFGVNIGSIGLNFYNKWYGGSVDPDRFFVFVNNRHLVERDYRRFVVPRDRVKIVLGRTRAVGKFDVVNNRVVNRGVDLRVVERATGRRIAPVSARTVIKPNAIITTVNEGKQIRTRERASHPIDVEAVRRGNAKGRGGGTASGGMESGAGNDSGPNNSSGAGPKGNGSDENAGTERGGGRRGGRGAGMNSGEQTSNPAAESPNGSSDVTPRRNRTRNDTGNAVPREGSMNGPEQSGASPTDGSKGSGNPRHRSSNTGSMGGPGSDTGGEVTSPAGEAPNANAMRRHSASPSNMNGPGASPGNGAAARPPRGMANTPPSTQTAQPPQPDNADTQPKKKRKSKAEQHSSDSPQ